MLQYAEPVDARTFILLTPVPCNPAQEVAAPAPPEDTLPESSSITTLLPAPPDPSYAIGPVDTATLISLQVRLSTGETISFYIPLAIPLAVLFHPLFQQGFECGYTEGIPEDEAYTFPKLLNEVFNLLYELRVVKQADFCPWVVGFVLGELAYIAKQDRLLALTGLAHYCYILSFLTPGGWGYPFMALGWAWESHITAMKEYRALIRAFREQGKSFEEAQRLALHYYYTVPASAFKWVGPDGWPLDM